MTAGSGLTGGLAGLGVLVTRPAHQAQALSDAVEAAGGRALRLPLLSIVGPAEPQRVAAELRAARADAWWLFTSPNAVAWAVRLFPPAGGAWPSHLAAAGRGTSAALAAAGRSDALCPSRDGAAGLLALPQLQELAGMPVTVVTGEHGPPRLAIGLRKLGVVLHLVSVYRRVREAHDPSEVSAALTVADAAIVSSGGALEHLRDLTPAASSPLLYGLQLVLPSRRVVEMARQFGFLRQPLVPPHVGDDEFVHALVAWRQNEGKHAPP